MQIFKGADSLNWLLTLSYCRAGWASPHRWFVMFISRCVFWISEVEGKVGKVGEEAIIDNSDAPKICWHSCLGAPWDFLCGETVQGQ